jgi:hypothetical protein
MTSSGLEPATFRLVLPSVKNDHGTENQSPRPKGAVEPVKKEIPEVPAVSVVLIVAV